MANTDVTLVDDGGFYVPSLPSVTVAAGDTVSFTTNDGSQVLFYFSPDAVNAISPAPASPFVLAPGATAVFTFSTSDAGAYSVYVGADESAQPAVFPSDVSTELLLEIGGTSAGGGPAFNGPHIKVKTGS